MPDKNPTGIKKAQDNKMAKTEEKKSVKPAMAKGTAKPGPGPSKR